MRNVWPASQVILGMTKNPFLNAAGATIYIAVVASALYYGPKAVGAIEGIIVPVAFLSLFVLSAAMMGCFFLYQPALLLSEGRRREAAKLFLQTVAAFAGITGTFIVAWILLSAWL